MGPMRGEWYRKGLSKIGNVSGCVLLVFVFSAPSSSGEQTYKNNIIKIQQSTYYIR
jgi:hypothetical protein